MFECVINVSEGADHVTLDQIASACRGSLRDLHSDRDHNRSVFTLINEPATLSADVRGLIAATFERLDLRRHRGVHPRFGVVDVVPFVALDPAESSLAVELRDATGQWVVDRYSVPVFYYGPLPDGERTLPQVRRGAFTTLEPDLGPSQASATLGAVAIGQRPVLLAWNLWMRGVSAARAKQLAASVRRADVRALAFAVGDQMQVSCNLLAPERTGPDMVFDAVRSQLGSGEEIDHAELVGLAPRGVLNRIERTRWAQLGLDDATTIESRIG